MQNKDHYNYLDSDVSDGFGYKIQQLINARDAQQTTTDNLDQLIQEIGNGLKSASFFQKPRAVGCQGQCPGGGHRTIHQQDPCL